MSDIIERLHGPDGIEAAREITRLREENARLREALKPFADNRSFVFNGPEMREALRAAATAIREGGKDG